MTGDVMIHAHLRQVGDGQSSVSTLEHRHVQAEAASYDVGRDRILADLPPALVRRGEIVIAGGFGLLHGLSFASLLGSLQLNRSNLVTTLLGFNLGIEITQLLVVALVMPWLLLISRTPTYPIFRVCIATVGAALAAGWLAARTVLLTQNPLDPIGNLLVGHPLGLTVGLAVVAITVTARQRGRTAEEGARDGVALVR